MGNTFRIEVDEQKCNGCGNCVFVCPAGVLITDNLGRIIPAKLEACRRCHSCESICFSKAIKIYE